MVSWVISAPLTSFLACIAKKSILDLVFPCFYQSCLVLRKGSVLDLDIGLIKGVFVSSLFWICLLAMV